MNADLTIISVVHSPQNVRYTELNGEFAEKINRAKNWVWAVADNSPSELAGQLDRHKFSVIPGFKFEEMEKSIPKIFIGKRKVASYHHARAINACLPYVKTRFLLVLDNDFYIVRPDWASEVLQYMEEKNLAIFGVPWPPYQYLKYRYFPAPHALFIDLEKIPLKNVDFTPQFLVPRFDWITPLKTYLPASIIRFFKDLRARRSIGFSRDTAYSLYQKYYRSDMQYECVTPVFKPPASRGVLSKALKIILPDQWQFVPKKKGYFTETGFGELGYFSALAYGGDEFMWQGKPFGFHVRRFKKSSVPLTPEEEINVLEDALASFV